MGSCLCSAEPSLMRSACAGVRLWLQTLATWNVGTLRDTVAGSHTQVLTLLLPGMSGHGFSVFLTVLSGGGGVYSFLPCQYMVANCSHCHSQDIVLWSHCGPCMSPSRTPSPQNPTCHPHGLLTPGSHVPPVHSPSSREVHKGPTVCEL